MSSYLASRWQSFSAVLLAVSIAGTPYAFGIFSEIFKKELFFSQTNLSIIGSSGSTGLYTGVFCGIALEKIGPRNLLLCGGLFVFVGNFYIWLAVQHIVWASVPMISFAYFLAQVGIACTTMTATPLSIQIFPSEVTGQVAGLSKAYFGISSAVLATISAGFFESTSTDFILFVTLFIPLVQFSAAKNANFLPQSLRSFRYEIALKRYHSLWPYICHLLGVLLLIITSALVKHFLPSSSTPSKISVALSLLVCLHLLSLLIFPAFYGPRFIPNDLSIEDEDADDTYHSSASSGFPVAVIGGGAKGGVTHKSYMSLTSSSHSSVDTAPSLLKAATAARGDIELNFSKGTRGSKDSHSSSSATAYHPSESYQESGGDRETERLREGAGQDEDDEEIKLSSALSSSPTSSEFISFYNRHVPLKETVTMWRCYALMATFMCITGSGLLVINNIQAIAQALHQEASPLFVTVLSLANACGRLSVGLLADYFQASLSRLQLLSFIALAMALAQYLLSLGSLTLLYPCLLLVGFMFGAGFSNVAAVTSDIFGSKFIGSNYGFIDLAPALGSYLFSTALIALFYVPSPSSSSGTSGETSGEGTGMCYGSSCFRTPFLITAVSCLISAVVALGMHSYTKIIKKQS